MISSETNRGRLKHLRDTKDNDINLAAAALDIAALQRQSLNLAPYYRHLESLSKDVMLYADKSPTVDNAAEAMMQVIAKRYGYVGDEECLYDTDGTNLATVIDERRGIPVALGIIYLHVARIRGWDAAGIDFPGRFLVRLEVDSKRRILDPFSGGRSIDTKEMRDLLKEECGLDAELIPDHYAEIGNCEILLRLENSQKIGYLKAERFEDALRAIEIMLLFAPKTPALWREASIIHVRLNNVKKAISSLEEFLHLDINSESRHSACAVLQDLRNQLNEY